MSRQRAVLITGAGGFIGRRLVQNLAGNGWRVVAATRNDGVTLPPGIASRRIAPLEQMRPDDWRPLLEGVDHIVHLAGIAHTGPGVPEALYDAVNHRATAVLAEAARAAGVRRMVFVSSVRAISGPCSERVLTDAATPQPTDPYGRSKLAAEDALAASGMSHVILRPVLVVGPDARGNVAQILRIARLGVPVPLAGLSARRSVVSLDDVAEAVAWALEAPEAVGRRFILADTEPLTAPDMLREACAGMGVPARLFAVPDAVLRLGLGALGRAETWRRIGCDLVADASEIKACGFVFRHPAREALRSAARHAVSSA